MKINFTESKGEIGMGEIYEYCCVDMRAALKEGTFKVIMTAKESHVQVNHRNMKSCPFCGSEIEINDKIYT